MGQAVRNLSVHCATDWIIVLLYALKWCKIEENQTMVDKESAMVDKELTMVDKKSAMVDKEFA